MGKKRNAPGNITRRHILTSSADHDAQIDSRPQKIARCEERPAASLELRDLLRKYDTQLPPPLFKQLEGRSHQLEAANEELEYESLQRGAQINTLCADVETATRRVDYYQQRCKEKDRSLAKLGARLNHEGNTEGMVKALEEEKRVLDNTVKEQNQIINCSTVFLQKQTERVAALAAENVSLRTTIHQRDERISQQTKHLFAMSSASGNLFTNLALENQAQAMLSMLNGLRTDIADRDHEIMRLRAKCQTMKSVDDREVVATAAAKIKEVMSIADAQETLIVRLLDENMQLRRGAKDETGLI